MTLATRCCCVKLPCPRPSFPPMPKSPSSGAAKRRNRAANSRRISLVSLLLSAWLSPGLAFGIDACAHRGALKAGVTIAVLGCGIDRIYPSRHRGLALEISSSGAVVSEFPLGAPPRKHHFPQRNRIISGLARGTIVAEAAKRSGSISTAMHAAEQGREVFAVPGSPRNPMSKGCHLLIAQGVKLIECALDVVDECTDLPLAVPPALTRTRTVVGIARDRSL